MDNACDDALAPTPFWHLEQRRVVHRSGRFAYLLNPAVPAVVLSFCGSAPPVASIAGWHEVRLTNGVTGYVSKAWTERVGDLAPPAAFWAAMLRIGAWNVKKLGHGSKLGEIHT